MKLLGISGSPRRGGNTDRLLNEAISGAAGKGAQVKHIVLADLDIAPCSHCDGCVQTGGRCVIEDDMQQIHLDIREYDRFIVASPIYFMGITAQVKAMIDRCQALWVIKNILKLPVGLDTKIPRKGAFISAGATDYGNLFTGSIVTMKSWYKTLDIEYTADVLAPGVDSYNSLAGQPALLARAFSLGQQLAS